MTKKVNRVVWLEGILCINTSFAFLDESFRLEAVTISSDLDIEKRREELLTGTNCRSRTPASLKTAAVSPSML